MRCRTIFGFRLLEYVIPSLAGFSGFEVLNLLSILIRLRDVGAASEIRVRIHLYPDTRIYESGSEQETYNQPRGAAIEANFPEYTNLEVKCTRTKDDTRLSYTDFPADINETKA
jgi:hypothetical protein